MSSAGDIDGAVAAAVGPRDVSWVATGVVVAAGSGLVALYALATSRLFLPDYFPDAGVSLDWIKIVLPRDEDPVESYLVLTLTTCVLYSIALGTVARWGGSVPRVLLLGFPVVFALMLLLMYPPTAVDLFHYHADARTLWIFDRNPLTVPPAETGYPIGISWADQPSPYGPLWSLLTVVLAPLMVFGDHLVATAIGFKVLAALTYLGCAWLVYLLVRRTRPGLEVFAFVLFAWNPFVLLRVVGNGHNDLAMMLLALAALWMARERNWTLVFPLLACSVLVKYTSALLGPPLLLFAWFAIEGSTRERVRALAPGIGLAAVLVVLSYVPFWAGLETFDTVTRQAELTITSIPDYLISIWFEPLDPGAAQSRARLVTLGAFVLLAIPVTWQARKGFDHLLVAGFSLMFLYLVIAAGWFRPWYMLWPATLLAVRPTPWSVALFLAITLGNLFPDVIEQFRGSWGLSSNLQARGAPLAAQFLLPVVIWVAAVARWRSFGLDARETEP